MASEMLNMAPAINEVEAQIREMEHDFEAKIKPYRENLKALRKINEACENCCGKGKVLRSRACAEDDRPDPNDPRDYNTCPICFGSGRTPQTRAKK